MLSSLRIFITIFTLLTLAVCINFVLGTRALAQTGNISDYSLQDISSNDTNDTASNQNRQEHSKNTRIGQRRTIEITKEHPLSILEKAYNGRVQTSIPVRQFGYDLFTDTESSESQPTPMGAVQDDFVLGTGDELLITFTGQRTDQKLYKIDPRGNITIKDLRPIPAAGKTLAQLRNLLNAQLTDMHNTQSYVSLSAVRQIGVLVVGNVKKPGRKTLSAFNSVLDALNYSEGIKKDGSLRQIKLVRKGRSTIIDLYNLLLDGAPDADILLKDGDRIIVPPIGASIAITGAVKRPRIYEIKQATAKFHNKNTTKSKLLTLNKALKLAGGAIFPNQNRFIHHTLDHNKQENISEIKDFTKHIIKDGSIINVISGTAKRKGTIELVGETNNPGLYDLSRNNNLSTLLKNPNILGNDIYPLLGIIERWDTEQLSTRFLSFPVRSVLKNEFDMSLAENDVIRLFSNKEISTLFDVNKNETKEPEIHKEKPVFSNSNSTKDAALKIYLKEHSLHVRGAVRRPGHYPIAQGITLKNILAVAGGVTLDANLDSIEITSANFGTGGQAQGRSGTQRMVISLNDNPATKYTLSAGDSVRINQKYRKLEDKSVKIIGEVLHPGEYSLLSGDTVLSLIKRAGGLTEQAYPAGAIFSRESERHAEELRFREAAHDMQRALATAVKDDKNRPDATQIEMVRSLASELENIEAVGRITIQADPAVLTVKPEQNMLLEDGDRLYIPKRPLSVRVSGEVLSPSTLQFIEKKSPLDYIHEAGGFTFHADKNRTFVLYPNGSAQPLQVNTWNHKPIFIPPGSTIIVPRDPKPFDFIEGAKEIGQILSNLAVTAVFIDDIRD